MTFHKYIVLLSVCFFAYCIFGAGSSGYLGNILKHPLIQCRLKGGTCMNINQCNTTLNIYKDICKSYNYHDVCCISRETVCHKFSGFCTNSSDFCLTAGKLFRGGYGHSYRPVVLSWLACNTSHRCCHPINTKKSGYSHGGGHGHGGGYGHGGGHGHGGGYGHGGGHGHGGGYGHGGGHGHGGGYGGHLTDEAGYQGGSHGGYGHGGHGHGGYGHGGGHGHGYGKKKKK